MQGLTRNIHMTTPKNSADYVTLAEQDGLGAFSVSTTRFDAFEATIDQQLEKLIEAWKPFAAPKASTRAIRSSTSEDHSKNA
jgi:hypothetical protein